MIWNCVQIEERLSDYLDSTLTPGEIAEFHEHLGACPRCAPLLAQVSHVVGQMRALEFEPVPPALVSGILDKTIGPRKPRREWLSWIPLLWQPRFAMGIATVAIAAAMVIQFSGVRSSNFTFASLNPVNLYHSTDRHAHLAVARSVKFVNDLRAVYEIQSFLQSANGNAQKNQQAAPQRQNEPKSHNDSQQQTLRDRMSVVAAVLADSPGRSHP